MSSAHGTHQVTMDLLPEGLGALRATVTVDAERVVVHLSTESAEAREAVARSLPALRHHLGADGASVSVTVGQDGGAGQGRSGHAALRGPAQVGGAARPPDASDTNPPPVPTPGTRRLVDVQL